VPEVEMPTRGSKAIYRELRRSPLNPRSTTAGADEAEIRWICEWIARALQLTEIWD
jgi:hypothetical protein